MMRGDDVAELQTRLGRLGFGDAGRVDGVFGPDTLEALEEFQHNVGIAGDGICGPDSVAALVRLGLRVNESPSVAEPPRAGVAPAGGNDPQRGTAGGRRERWARLAHRRGPAGAQRGGRAGAHAPPSDWSVQARRTNEFAATAWTSVQHPP